MLRTINDLEDYAIRASDGDIGHVKDVYFDDQTWAIRYLVVDTGTWLSNQKVLISPIAIGNPNWENKVLPVSITKDQVRNSPSINTDMPVSRQQEMQVLDHYGYPYYWEGYGSMGGGVYPNLLLSGYANLSPPHNHEDPELKRASVEAQAALHKDDDLHLRSCEAVKDYHVHATDGDIGHIQDMLVDDESWAMRYMIVNTSNWWLGHQVLIPPNCIQNMNWPDAQVSVNLTRQAVKDSPPYNPEMQVDRKTEMYIYKHYGLTGYWIEAVKHGDSKPTP
ncbi:PRC-barrel domain-containing protein [Leucothrix arctica]|uniref:Photosystem reaction center subunit H n=1 Tax=Leucothrix arctica TaxID=1481894 RepID=A0A317C686_9GAMM|nr:PRC-barrel domain-containing protein [Leucothrix arctica]PWQ93817.1 photosystem reaction center subunit H [Leucothrix arctica]